MPATAAPSAAAAASLTPLGAALGAIAHCVMLLAALLTGAWLAAWCGRCSTYGLRRTWVEVPIPRRAPLLIPVMIPPIAIAPITTASLSAPAITLTTPLTAL